MTFHFAFYYNKLLKESLISFCGICFSKLTSLNLSLTIWTLCVCICVCVCVCETEQAEGLICPISIGFCLMFSLWNSYQFYNFIK